MKKKQIKIIIIIVGIFLLFLIGLTIFTSNEKNKSSGTQLRKATTPEERTIVCTLDSGHDEVKKVEEVHIQKGILITRKDVSTWSKENPKKQTCDYYTLQSQKLNAHKGVESTITCDEYKGVATTIYHISELDREELKLKQFDYLEKNDVFNADSWKSYMKANEYTCKEQ